MYLVQDLLEPLIVVGTSNTVARPPERVVDPPPASTRNGLPHGRHL